MPTVGLDIGGANIKAASHCGKAKTIPFAMWKHPHRLSEQLVKISSGFNPQARIAVTMTGEMADCFASRTVGVRHIVACVLEAFPDKEVSFFGSDGTWLSSNDAASQPLRLAASNWRALAQWVANRVDGLTLLCDIGSTTTDLIMVKPNCVETNSISDLDRLLSGELVYTGIERSSVNGLLQFVDANGQRYPIVNEYFASTADVYTVLGSLPANENCLETCDGRPRTILNCKIRLLRCIGTDLDHDTNALAVAIAESTFKAQCRLVADAIAKRVRFFDDQSLTSVVLSGHGDFLCQSALQLAGLDVPLVSLIDQMTPELSRVAPAYAVANLAEYYFEAS